MCPSMPIHRKLNILFSLILIKSRRLNTDFTKDPQDPIRKLSTVLNSLSEEKENCTISNNFFGLPAKLKALASAFAVSFILTRDNYIFIKKRRSTQEKYTIFSSSNPYKPRRKLFSFSNSLIGATALNTASSTNTCKKQKRTISYILAYIDPYVPNIYQKFRQDIFGKGKWNDNGVGLDSVELS